MILFMASLKLCNRSRAFGDNLSGISRLEFLRPEPRPIIGGGAVEAAARQGRPATSPKSMIRQLVPVSLAATNEHVLLFPQFVF
jgi:hypothetical protein